jgi:hypothetical protein
LISVDHEHTLLKNVEELYQKLILQPRLLQATQGHSIFSPGKDFNKEQGGDPVQKAFDVPGKAISSRESHALIC